MFTGEFDLDIWLEAKKVPAKAAVPSLSTPAKKETKKKKVKGKRSKGDLTKELMLKEYVEESIKAQSLQSAIFNTVKTHPFIGSVLQCMNILYTHRLDTAGISFNNDLKRWDLAINPYYFCKRLKPEHRKAILLHEIYHIIHKHPMRVPFMKISPNKTRLMNIAMDMSINQYIKDIPDGCSECPPRGPGGGGYCSNEDCCGRSIHVKDFTDYDEKTSKTTPWTELQAAEFYYEKMLERLTDPEDGEVQLTVNGKAVVGQKGGKQNSQGKSMGSAGGGASSVDLPDTIDVHDWGSTGGEEGDMLDATEDLMKRAMYKQDFSFDDLPGAVKDLMEHIKVRRAELNYRALILLAMRASLPSNVRKHSWTRKSKRFGNKAPGTRNGSQPKLEMFIDTSGSISVEEATEFLEITDEFLKVGARQCHLNMFHTRNYYSEKYKMGQGLDKDAWQSGGTCLNESFTLIAKKRPDLSVFLTDGYYSDIDVEAMVGPAGKFPMTVFIISKDGNEKHPFYERDWAVTVKIPSESTRGS